MHNMQKKLFRKPQNAGETEKNVPKVNWLWIEEGYFATVSHLVCFHFSNWVHEWILTFEFWFRLLHPSKEKENLRKIKKNWEFLLSWSRFLPFHYFRFCHSSNNKIGSFFNNFSISSPSNIYRTEVKVHYLSSVKEKRDDRKRSKNFPLDLLCFNRLEKLLSCKRFVSK